LTDERVNRETARKSKIDGDLYIESGRVEADDDKLTVSGVIRCERDCELIGDIEAGELVSDRGDVFISGSLSTQKIEIRDGRLETTGSVTTEELRVSKSIQIGGDLKTDNARIGGSAEIIGNANANRLRIGGSLRTDRDVETESLNVGGSTRIEGNLKSVYIDVGGSFKANTVEAEEVDLGGSFTSYGPVKLESIRVGGTVKVGGGTINRRIDVGGTFHSSEHLEFGDINVGGTVKLEAGGTGKGVDVGGTLSSDGLLKFKKIDVGGTVKLNDGGSGEDVSVGGTMRCRGDLIIENRLKVGGKITVDGVITANNARIGGKIEVDKIITQQYIETSNLYTRDGAKSTRIEIDRRGKVKGPLVAEIVTIKDRASVEDIYADRIQLRRGCRAANLYGRVIWIDTGCEVDSVVYTEELRADGSVRIRQGSQKRDELPEPPL
jgi:cytoskeletal protein CcmA (bactofilin family)